MTELYLRKSLHDHDSSMHKASNIYDLNSYPEYVVDANFPQGADTQIRVYGVCEWDNLSTMVHDADKYDIPCSCSDPDQLEDIEIIRSDHPCYFDKRQPFMGTVVYYERDKYFKLQLQKYDPWNEWGEMLAIHSKNEACGFDMMPSEAWYDSLCGEPIQCRLYNDNPNIAYGTIDCLNTLKITDFILISDNKYGENISNSGPKTIKRIIKNGFLFCYDAVAYGTAIAEYDGPGNATDYILKSDYETCRRYGDIIETKYVVKRSFHNYDYFQ